MKAIRWGDNDHYVGPFTFCFGDYKRFALSLHSGGQGDDDDGPPSLRLSIWTFTFIARLPFMAPPHRTKIYPSPESWEPDVVARLGRNWYWDVEPREYGFSYGEGFLQVFYGIHPCDSSRDQVWSCFLPWTQWRHIRHSFYDLNGKHFWSELEAETENYRRARRLGRSDMWDERREIVRQWEERCPTEVFSFKDFDGEELTVTTRIEEREWRFGTGWFKWLSMFRKPKIQRSLDLQFSGETGKRKGSWKGGTIGHSIGMLPGELHESAFQRYCDEHQMVFQDTSTRKG